MSKRRFEGFERILTTLSALLVIVPHALGAADDLAKWDSRMAVETASVDTNGVKWIDGKYLPIEGRAFDDTEHYYDRLPANVTTNVNEGVRSMKHHTAGMQFRFITDSKRLTFRWVPWSSCLSSDNVVQIAMSGIDIYRQDHDGKWSFVQAGRIAKATGAECTIAWTSGTPCLVNLPLYNGVKSFALGIDKDAKIYAIPFRKNGITKPVVFYGTSITHGASASRPGLCFVNLVGRNLDVPVVNLGFSGCGVMEFEMSEHLARIDASCYVLDCLWNMSLKEDPKRPGCSVEGNYEKFVRNLRAKRPGVPIVMAEQCDVFMMGPNEKDRFMRRLHEKFIAEGWKDLVYLPKDGMYTGDLEGAIDGCHPNDWGMMSMAKAFGKAIAEALKLK